MSDPVPAPVQPVRFEFGNLDQIMLLMMMSAGNLIEKQWTVEHQAKRIAEYNASFINLRIAHEETHVTKLSMLCPFCSSLKLNQHLHREEGTEK